MNKKDKTKLFLRCNEVVEVEEMIEINHIDCGHIAEKYLSKKTCLEFNCCDEEDEDLLLELLKN